MRLRFALQTRTDVQVPIVRHQSARLVDAIAGDLDAAGHAKRLPSVRPSTHAAAMHSQNIESMRSKHVMGLPAKREAVIGLFRGCDPTSCDAH